METVELEGKSFVLTSFEKVSSYDYTVLHNACSTKMYRLKCYFIHVKTTYKNLQIYKCQLLLLNTAYQLYYFYNEINSGIILARCPSGWQTVETAN